MLTTAERDRSRLVLALTADVSDARECNALECVQEEVYSYLSEKALNCPNDLFSRDSYDDEDGILSAEKIETSTLKIWAARFNEPDTDVAGRAWSVELIVAEVDKKLTLASRLTCFSRHLDFNFEPSVPRIYKKLTERGVLFADGAKLARWPIDVRSDDEVDWLFALINNKRRTRDIIVLSASQDGICQINPNEFANSLTAAAHVVRIFPNAAHLFSQRVGKFLSVFDQGIRIYKPTKQLEIDEPVRHPLFTKRRLQSIDLEYAQLSIGRDAFRTSVETNLRTNAIPSFAKIRTESFRFRLAELQKSKSDTEIIPQLMSERDVAVAAKIASEAQVNEALDLAAQEDVLRKQAEEDRDFERGRNIALVARVRALESKLAEVNASEDRAYPLSYDGIEEWVDASFAGRLSLHNRARRSLRDAQYEDVSLVCKMLESLATDYVDGKRGNRECYLSFEQTIKDSSVEISKSISDNKAGEQGDEYFVIYRGRRQQLELHLKRGTSREQSRNMRIYFFWDEEDEQVIVGYLPGHLDNRLT
jgi:hypothetical protein